MLTGQFNKPAPFSETGCGRWTKKFIKKIETLSSEDWKDIHRRSAITYTSKSSKSGDTKRSLLEESDSDMDLLSDPLEPEDADEQG